MCQEAESITPVYRVYLPSLSYDHSHSVDESGKPPHDIPLQKDPGRIPKGKKRQFSQLETSIIDTGTPKDTSKESESVISQVWSPRTTRITAPASSRAGTLRNTIQLSPTGGKHQSEFELSEPVGSATSARYSEGKFEQRPDKLKGDAQRHLHQPAPKIYRSWNNEVALNSHHTNHIYNKTSIEKVRQKSDWKETAHDSLAAPGLHECLIDCAKSEVHTSNNIPEGSQAEDCLSNTTESEELLNGVVANGGMISGIDNIPSRSRIGVQHKYPGCMQNHSSPLTPRDLDDKFQMDIEDEGEMLKLLVTCTKESSPFFSSPLAPGTEPLIEQGSDHPLQLPTPQKLVQPCKPLNSLMTTAFPRQYAEEQTIRTPTGALHPCPPIAEANKFKYLTTNELEPVGLPTPISNSKQNAYQNVVGKSCQVSVRRPTSSPAKQRLGHEPLNPFARPNFPAPVFDRCQILGVTSSTVLRTCFRVGEILREGRRCDMKGQRAVIEFYGRVIFSSREPSMQKQIFKFADLFHDRPPFLEGILINYSTTCLSEIETSRFLNDEESVLARCIATLQKDSRNDTWILNVTNIRETSWSEIEIMSNIVCGNV